MGLGGGPGSHQPLPALSSEPLQPPALLEEHRGGIGVCWLCAGWWWRHQDHPDGRAIVVCECAPAAVTTEQATAIHDRHCCCEWLWPRRRRA